MPASTTSVIADQRERRQADTWTISISISSVP